ncbi:MAG TPA: hypothetical protein VGY58_22600 [Gemmataceae bacterium]|jgi:hypothetical protein|nr:hypothetical protein [Gemmataceae bacterium]
MPRPFNRESLTAHTSEAIRAAIGIGAMVWRYTVLVPVEETRAGESSRQIASDDDIDSLQHMLTAHFQGLTVASQRGTACVRAKWN